MGAAGKRISDAALESLLEARERFVRFVVNRVGSRATAEDIVQSAFVRGIERGGAIQQDESAVAWFYRILRNAVVDHYRRVSSSDAALQELAAELERSPGATVQVEDDICQCVSPLLQAMRPEYRTALEIVDLGDGALKDLVEKAGISAGNAAVRIHRARAALRKQVERACGTCATHGCLNCSCRSRQAGDAVTATAG